MTGVHDLVYCIDLGYNWCELASSARNKTTTGASWRERRNDAARLGGAGVVRVISTTHNRSWWFTWDDWCSND